MNKKERLREEKRKTDLLLRKVGFIKRTKRTNLKSNWDTSFLKDKPTSTVPLSNNLKVSYEGGTKKDPLAYKWKRGREESPDTIRELEKKRMRVSPLYNKGGLQYITDAENPETLGRKI